ncbi:ElyC/SanA/YdcF family protein [Litoribacillus peritrichatus]|uniref:Envelope biogenesis factor ElyC n=1 Tax=Litoribacillus peritrichatus TaxID=718191 RepID=A0ABP7NDC1_9GAMM
MEPLFIVKKLTVALVAPLSIALIIGIAGLINLIRGRKKSGVFWVCLSLIVVWVSSFNPIANRLLLPLESKYTPYQYQAELAVGYVHVLGGGHMEGARLPGEVQLSSTSLARLVEGLRIANLHPESVLVLSGYAGIGSRNQLSNAEAAKKIALSLGFPEHRIQLFPEAKDTREEARSVAKLVGELSDDASLVVVTSASHLPRAMNIFEQEGLSPIPAPTYFLASEGSGGLYPSADAVNKTQRWLYEQVGLLWVELKALLSE